VRPVSSHVAVDLPPLEVEDVRARITATCWRQPHSVDRVGLEAEAFVVHVDRHGRPSRRADLHTAVEVLQAVAETSRDEAVESARSSAVPSVIRPTGARVSLEPGAQLEIATVPRAGVAAALADLEAASAALRPHLAANHLAAVPVGLDPWHPVPPQYLRAPRYPAMAAYFDRRGPAGRVMMRHTAALQVNLDLGDPPVAAQRWLVANLAAPLIVATFACSPTPGAVNGRASVWSRVDPTRTGIPPMLVSSPHVPDPIDALTDAALTADVLLHKVADGGMVPGRSGFTFRHWVRHGHPAFGRPTIADLDYHLSTLFPEVRVRGYLELRGVDALPARWQAVPPVLLAGLLYDNRARDAVRAVLQPHRHRLPSVLQRAAARGVADPALCALAVETWSYALQGAARLPAGHVDRAQLRLAESFLDRFTLRGRTPSDELRERLASSPTAALRWASEPAVDHVLT
jgi:glutamate--cysteine ligase